MERVLEHSVLNRGRRRGARRRVRYVAAEGADADETERAEQLVGGRERQQWRGDEEDEDEFCDDGDGEQLECGAPLIKVPVPGRRLGANNNQQQPAALKRSAEQILKEDRTRSVCTRSSYGARNTVLYRMLIKELTSTYSK